jgi:ethanolamine permease
MVTLLLLSVGTLVLNSGVGPGALGVGESSAPLEVGFRSVFSGTATPWLLALISLTGLIASFHSIIYAYGRLLFALSRAGYYPRGLAALSRWRTPHAALITGGAIGLALCFVASRYSDSVGPALLNMAVFGALLSYILVLVSYLRLKADKPHMRRPYVSPLGSAGALTGIVLALICLVATFAVPSFRPGVIGVAIFLGVMLVWYWLFRRRSVEVL